MSIRIAAYNVENLFDRPKAMSGPMTSAGNPVLNAHARVNALIQEEIYTPAIKAEILEHLKTLKLLKSDDAEFAVLRQVRGRLLKRGAAGTEVVAEGRSSWIGWVDLEKARVSELAMKHTAQVISDVDATILGVVEAESRVALKHFTDPGIVGADNAPLYPHVMVIDGNDDRGIDVGLMTKSGHPIVSVSSHVDDVDDTGRTIFGRDCPEYTVVLPSGKRIVLLVNHFKSKGYGTPAQSNATRKRQAARAAEIYEAVRARGEKYVVLLGDLNDTPDSDPLGPLLTQTDLKDASTHPTFSLDPERPGTYGNGTKSQKIDYLLLSPALFAKVTGGAIFRMGVWGGKNGTLFPHYPTMKSPVHAGSDHAAIYADINLG